MTVVTRSMSAGPRPHAPTHPPERHGGAKGPSHTPRRSPPTLVGALFRLLVILLAGPAGHAELQFDVFLGHEDRIREGHWFPVAFEILNDGPTFTGTVSIGPDGGIDTQRHSFSIELPTHTRKHLVVPLFSASGRYSRWEARLQDRTGKVLAERTDIAPKDVAASTPLLGAIPRTFGGLPVFPELRNRAPEFAPAVARLQPALLGANPLVYEGLTAIYLSSEKALDLKAEQVDALLSWLHQGGHLIVAVDQPTDVNGLPWLAELVPFRPESTTRRHLENTFDRWLVSGRPVLQIPSTLRRPPIPGPGRPRNRATNQRTGQVTAQPSPVQQASDPFASITPEHDFNNAEIPIVTGRATEGDVILGLGDLPLVVSTPRGRGTVTVLAFSPEREPFRGWKNRPWFWAKLVGLPPELVAESESVRGQASGIDGIFGAMLDSRQIRKLPVGALLLLLVVYLAVIGPFDQWVLKRMGKQMWTWITFPTWVALFSALIYFIGYRLRAGDLEWNELQVVDQLPRPGGSALRGRTWASLYSPSNDRYRFASDQPFATMRAEFQSGGGRNDGGRLALFHRPRGVEAEAWVPVWVNQLFASDWVETSPTLLEATLTTNGPSATLTLHNASALDFLEIQVAYHGRLHALGPLPPGGRIERALAAQDAAGRPLDSLTRRTDDTAQVVNQRRYAFGSQGAGWIQRGLDPVIMASLLGYAPPDATTSSYDQFSPPEHFDLTHLHQRGEALVFGWAPTQAVAAPIHRFSPVRHQRSAVLRVSVRPSPAP